MKLKVIDKDLDLKVFNSATDEIIDDVLFDLATYALFEWVKEKNSGKNCFSFNIPALGMCVVSESNNSFDSEFIPSEYFYKEVEQVISNEKYQRDRDILNKDRNKTDKIFFELRYTEKITKEIFVSLLDYINRECYTAYVKNKEKKFTLKFPYIGTLISVINEEKGKLQNISTHLYLSQFFINELIAIKENKLPKYFYIYLNSIEKKQKDELGIEL